MSTKVKVWDKLEGVSFDAFGVVADEIVAKSGFRYALGEAGERITAADWAAHLAGTALAAPAAVERNVVLAGEPLPMPAEEPFNGADPASFDHDGDGEPGGSKKRAAR